MSRRPLVAAAAFLLLFVALTVAVHSGWLRALDLELLLALHPLDLPFLHVAGSLLSTLGAIEVETPMVLAGVAVLWWRGRRRPALALALFFPLALLGAALKMTVEQPGVPGELHRTLFYYLPSGDPHTPYAYPSGHVLRFAFLCGVAAIAAGTGMRGLSRTLTLAAIAALLLLKVASRPYLGEHWPTDVLGALLLAGAAASLAAAIWMDGATNRRAVPPRRAIEADRRPPAGTSAPVPRRDGRASPWS